MDFADLFQAISAGILLYAGILHLAVGLRSEPRDRVHLFFAVASLLWGMVGVSLFLLYAAFDAGSLDQYVVVDRVSIALFYLGYPSLFWFVAAYTRAYAELWVRRALWFITSLYLLIVMLCFVLPYPWVYTDIELTDAFPPDIVVAPWYSAEQVVSTVLILAFCAYCIARQYRRGERGAATALGVAMGIYLAAVLWDYGIEYGLFDTVLIGQYGFLAFIVMMSLRLTDEAVKAMKEARRLNTELEDRVKKRTSELNEAKESAEAAVKQLLESERRLDYVLRSARLALWEYDLETRETVVTDVLPYLLGYEPDELLLESDDKWRGYQLDSQSLEAQLLHPDDKESYAAEMASGKETTDVEFRLRLASGQWNWFRQHGKTVHWDDAGKPLLEYGVLIDINDMKSLQLELTDARDAADETRRAADAANRAKSVFLANMSHELRTPLNAILGFTQIIQRDKELPQRQAENLEIISRSGVHLLELINDVLEISKIEAGRSDLTVSAFDLYRTLDSLEEMTRVRANEKGLTLSFQREPDVPRYIKTDEGKLRQVLINILGNAVKFTYEGGVALRAEVSPPSVPPPGGEEELSPHRGELEGGERVKLFFEIEDTGVGIAEEEMEALFEPFGQTASGQHLREGTGLGLPISRQFVRLMGGEITVRSEEGQGTAVNFDIAVELAEESDAVPAEPERRVIGLASEQVCPDGTPYRILVADDAYDNRAMLRQLLQGVGFAVQEAVNGQDAIDRFDAWQPHLVWMDMRMPVMDGYEATRRIKASEQGKNTPVIALTASAFEEERAEVLAAGCDDFVRKPIREGEIFGVMEEHLGVAYVYEEVVPESYHYVKLTPADLAEMPEEWVSAVRDAATRGREQQLLSLIESIEADYPELAKGLRAMVNRYQFRQIVALSE